MANQSEKSQKPLPKLPFGEGSYTYNSNGSIKFQKNWNGQRIAVYGNTVKEANKKMKEKIEQKEKEKKIKSSPQAILSDSMSDWLKSYKKNQLQPASYDVLEATINNYIVKYGIGSMPLYTITSDVIQEHITELIEKNYSYSTIKKVYEALNGFFNHKYLRLPTENPMLSCIKPTRESIDSNRETDSEEDLHFLDEQQTRMFIREATRIRKYTKNPAHKWGWYFVGMLYTGMRVNESRALTWSDISFDNKTIIVKKQFSTIKDRSGQDKKTKQILKQPKTKKSKRIIHLSKEALNAFTLLKEQQNPSSEDDYILSSESTGLPINITTINSSFHNILRNCNIPQMGIHSLRHTCASMYLRNGVDQYTVASMLGHGSLDMINRVYRHLTEAELLNASNKI